MSKDGRSAQRLKRDAKCAEEKSPVLKPTLTFDRASSRWIWTGPPDAGISEVARGD
jgi:hypothetical protein